MLRSLLFTLVLSLAAPALSEVTATREGQAVVVRADGQAVLKLDGPLEVVPSGDTVMVYGQGGFALELPGFRRGLALFRHKRYWTSPVWVSDPAQLAGDNQMLVWGGPGAYHGTPKRPPAAGGTDQNSIGLLGQLRKGDVVVVWKLDRLSRSLKDVLTLMDEIAKSGAGFRSLTEAIETSSAAGRMLMQMIGTFAEFERAMLRERTRNGLDAARKQGRIGGRRPKLNTHQQEEIVRLVHSGKKTAADAARLFNVHPATVSRILERAKAP